MGIVKMLWKKCEDNNERFWIGLNDLSSLYDKITIVELLEQAKL